MTYKAVGFDYGGVITGEPGPVVSKTIARLLGVEEEQYRSAYYRYNVALNEGRINWNELWEKVLSDLDLLDKKQQLITYWDKLKFGVPNQKILELITDLRKQGFKTGLLSNNTLKAAEQMRKDGLPTYFDAFDISADTGLVKPDPKAFLKLMDQLKVTPQEFIFIDDSPKSLSTAQKVGYTPILYRGYINTVSELKALVISIK